MKTIIILFSAMLIASCGIYFGPFTQPVPFITDENGYAILDCKGNIMYQASYEHFLKVNNLPDGTTEYYCKDGKAYLLD